MISTKCTVATIKGWKPIEGVEGPILCMTEDLTYFWSNDYTAVQQPHMPAGSMATLDGRGFDLICEPSTKLLTKSGSLMASEIKGTTLASPMPRSPANRTQIKEPTLSRDYAFFYALSGVTYRAKGEIRIYDHVNGELLALTHEAIGRHRNPPGVRLQRVKGKRTIVIDDSPEIAPLFQRFQDFDQDPKTNAARLQWFVNRLPFLAQGYDLDLCLLWFLAGNRAIPLQEHDPHESITKRQVAVFRADPYETSRMRPQLRKLSIWDRRGDSGYYIRTPTGWFVACGPHGGINIVYGGFYR
ncbi:MAG: hypothetical protein D6812_07470 [Deltaproteobacteria bacterium]|nr:MAG: hypothetical protein D6812_07470 [Deltaproteobacteria bacterium]